MAGRWDERERFMDELDAFLTALAAKVEVERKDWRRQDFYDASMDVWEWTVRAEMHGLGTNYLTKLRAIVVLLEKAAAAAKP